MRIVGARKNLEIEDEFKEAVEDLEITKVEIHVEEERMLRDMGQMGKIHKIYVAYFFGSLHLEELIDWINELEDYFEIEDVKNQQRVRLAQTKLKGHTTIWWK